MAPTLRNALCKGGGNGHHEFRSGVVSRYVRPDHAAGVQHKARDLRSLAVSLSAAAPRACERAHPSLAVHAVQLPAVQNLAPQRQLRRRRVGVAAQAEGGAGYLTQLAGAVVADGGEACA